MQLFGKKMERTLPKYAPSILPLLIIPCIGHSKSHFLPLVLNGKRSVDVLVSEFFCTAIYQWYFFIKGSHQCKFYFDSMCGGLNTPYGSNNMKIGKEKSLNVWITWSSGSIAYSFSVNWDGSKWITTVNFTLWHDLRLKHCHPPFLRIVFRHIFWQLWVNLLSF